MDAANLSSNWKKLQKSLGSSDSSDKPVTKSPNFALRKRKAVADPSIDSQVSKRSRIMMSTAEDLRQGHPEAASPKDNVKANAGKYIGLDCEMVGTNDVTPLAVVSYNRNAPPGAPPEYSILARASLVNFNGATIYDAYVLPPAGVRVSNYRTQWSGIAASHLSPDNHVTKPKSFSVVQKEVAALLQGRTLVGHALKNDLAVLGLSHPKRDIRDTSRFPKYRELAATVGRNGQVGKGRTPSLKNLASSVLGLDIQGGGNGHSSIEDASAAMLLFRREKAAFEEDIVKIFGRRPKQVMVTSSNPSPAKIATNGIHHDDLDSEDNESGEDQEDLDSDVDADVADSEAEANVKSVKTTTKKAKKKKKKKSRTKR